MVVFPLLLFVHNDTYFLEYLFRPSENHVRITPVVASFLLREVEDVGACGYPALKLVCCSSKYWIHGMHHKPRLDVTLFDCSIIPVNL